MVIFIIIAFIIWIIYKIRISNLIKELNIKSEYKNIKAEIKKQKLPKVLFWASLICTILWFLYTFFAIALVFVDLIFIIFTLGGAAYVDTGADPSFYYALLDFSKMYFNGIPFALIAPFFIITIVLIRVLYINHNIIKRLKLLPPSRNEMSSLENK